ncbi:MAG: PglZ domain-containing protein [Bacteroidaceae bacterium]|nr:PglZ domain-containing protein [Bacteroidaceae bacterium]
MLNYIYATDRHKVIHASELRKVTDYALSFQKIIEIDILKDTLSSILEESVCYDNILKCSKIWGEIIYQSYTISDESYLSLISQIDAYSDEFFLKNKMSAVFYASTRQNPKTVDKILHNIQAHKKDKIALLCFDCMGFAEWFLLKDYFSDLMLEYDEEPLFALLPSVTSISRQAIFSGSTDVYETKNPNRNSEITNFSSFFNHKETKSFSEKDEITDDSLIGYRYINILYNFFDDLGHSVIFPKKENTKSLYFDTIKSYLNKSDLLKTMSTLLKNNFNVYICSDHGSVLAKGNGVRLEKYYIDNFAKRAVIIPTQAGELLENKKIKIPFVDNKLIVLPEGRTMFTNRDKKEINHGGTSIEEMVVPYIKVNVKL